MKKYLIIFSLSLFAMAQLKAQTTNTFPTSGNVGIGTTSPLTNLDVKGNARASYSGSLYAQIEGNASGGVIKGVGGGGFLVRSYGATYFNGGNIGIGNTTPVYKLDVNGTGRFTSNLLIGDPNGARTEINTSLNHKVYNSAGIKTIDIDGNWKGGGFVGVYRADVQQSAVTMHANVDAKIYSCFVRKYMDDGSFADGVQMISILHGTDTEALTGLQLNTTNSAVVIGSWIGYEKNKGYGLINRFKTKLENDLYVETGNVGIGTTTPDSKLTVAGKVHAQEVKVTVNAGADFVFKDSYKLPSLKEVEQFIKANKHLPEIASEKEMQANGLLLGEMNIKLLQKIEELTLYTIQQQKQLKKQETINQELIGRLKKLEDLLLNKNN